MRLGCSDSLATDKYGCLLVIRLSKDLNLPCGAKASAVAEAESSSCWACGRRRQGPEKLGKGRDA